ncbi:MAG: hypothetical protein K0S39_144 [Paenibacillus sp.]|jgi:hypothetical protein|nr:hypothetical protein [Paenibacillus sp.]
MKEDLYRVCPDCLEEHPAYPLPGQEELRSQAEVRVTLLRRTPGADSQAVGTQVVDTRAGDSRGEGTRAADSQAEVPVLFPEEVK